MRKIYCTLIQAPGKIQLKFLSLVWLYYRPNWTPLSPVTITYCTSSPLVFEEAFSIYDNLGTGKIPMSSFFPLLRSLGYNIHKEEAFRYMNELDLAGIYHISTSDSKNTLAKFQVLLPWVPENFLARFLVSARGLGLRPTPKIPAAREKNLWYPG